MERETSAPILKNEEKYPLDEDRRDEILSALDEEIPENEPEKKFTEELQKDGDRLFHADFLEQLKALHPQQRLHLIAKSAGHVYVGADDFRPYFQAFPEDAYLVDFMATISGFTLDDNGYLNYILGCKALEAAAKSIPGRWEELTRQARDDNRSRRDYQLPNYLRVSHRSKLAREALIGDYKTPFGDILAKYGEEVRDDVLAYLSRAQDIELGNKNDILEPQSELFEDPAIASLPPEKRQQLIQEIIANCHLTIVFNEVHNSSFGEFDADNEINGTREYSMYQPEHSVLLRTYHPSRTYEWAQEHGIISDTYTDEKIINQAIYNLAEGGDQETIKFLLNFWGKNRDPLYGPAIADIISRIDAQIGVVSVLRELQSASEQDQHRLLSLLYRLELGRVGISEEGLNYLGRRFDLGEYNSGHNIAQRITADGKVGVFGPDRELEGFVQLGAGDFTGDPNEARQKEVLDVTYEMLFTPRPDETPDERAIREKILENFKANYFDTYLKLFQAGEQEHGLHFNNLSLPEQGFVLQFLTENQGDRALRDRFFHFLGNFGENGFFAFRSSEFDPEAAQNILALGESKDHADTERLFTEYRRTYGLGGQVAEHIMQMLQAQENALEVNLIRENILMMAQQFLTGNEEIKNRLISSELLNHELELVLGLPATIQGFMDGQLILGKFLRDHVPANKTTSPDYLASNIIAQRLQALYDNPDFNLRNYEGKTTNTKTSLEYVLAEIYSDERLQGSADRPDDLKIFDVGAGDGRMAIPLSKAGHRIVGIDISPRMVGQVSERIKEEHGDPMRINIQEGNFFDFDSSRFDQVFGPEKADVAIVMWHTLGFAGGQNGESTVLKNIFDNLRPGGKILIEMPDRNFGGYARALREFHAANSDTPFGTMIDAPSASSGTPTEQNQAISSPRYFPSQEEIITTLTEAGFNFEKAPTYFVQSEDGLVVKENLFVATKPIDKERLNKLQAYYMERRQRAEAAPLEAASAQPNSNSPLIDSAIRALSIMTPTKASSLL